MIIVDLIFISLIVSCIDHVFMCLLAICMFSLEKCLFKSSVHILFQLLVFFFVVVFWILSCISIYSERDGNTRPPDLLLEKFVCRSGSNS